jgi:hypothetical protein
MWCSGSADVCHNLVATFTRITGKGASAGGLLD